LQLAVEGDGSTYISVRPPWCARLELALHVEAGRAGA
jgi:hypothetical protein